jgi:hypothetical protein
VSFDDKLAAARRLRDEIGIARRILVDDLEGTVHRAYGALPNMTWVLGRGGTILYKAMWTSAPAVASYIERFAQQPPDLTHSPFHTEQLEVHRNDRELFDQGLQRNGLRAVEEMARAREIWAQRARDAAAARRS